jgi:hypothetical protein
MSRKFQPKHRVALVKFWSLNNNPKKK